MGGLACAHRTEAAARGSGHSANWRRNSNEHTHALRVGFTPHHVPDEDFKAPRAVPCLQPLDRQWQGWVPAQSPGALLCCSLKEVPEASRVGKVPEVSSNLCSKEAGLKRKLKT